MESFLVVFLLAFLFVVAAVARFVDASRRSHARERSMARSATSPAAAPFTTVRHDVGRLGERP